MKKSGIIIIVAFILSIVFNTQTIMAQAPEYLPFAQEMPQPIGGLKSIYSKIKYPEMARKTGIEGKVYILVYVNKNGSVDDAKIIKGIGAGCDEAALEGVKKSKFTVGKNQGLPVKVKLSISINFKIKA